jgi:hypothetical protein
MVKAKLKTMIQLENEGWKRSRTNYGERYLCYPQIKDPEITFGHFDAYNLLGKEVEILEYSPPDDNSRRNSQHPRCNVRINDYTTWVPCYLFEGNVGPADKTKRTVFDKRIRRQTFGGIDEEIEFYADHFRIGCRRVKVKEMVAMMKFVGECIGYRVAKK